MGAGLGFSVGLGTVGVGEVGGSAGGPVGGLVVGERWAHDRGEDSGMSAEAAGSRSVESIQRHVAQTAQRETFERVSTHSG